MNEVEEVKTHSYPSKQYSTNYQKTFIDALMHCKAGQNKMLDSRPIFFEIWCGRADFLFIFYPNFEIHDGVKNIGHARAFRTSAVFL